MIEVPLLPYRTFIYKILSNIEVLFLHSLREPRFIRIPEKQGQTVYRSEVIDKSGKRETNKTQNNWQIYNQNLYQNSQKNINIPKTDRKSTI